MARIISPKATIHPTAILPDDCEIGDYVYIGERVKILTPSFRARDYTKIHQDTFVNGGNPFNVGYNCWFGGHCIFDTIGGLTLGNNIGVGAYSQVWTHMRFGDTLAGCQWDKTKECIISDDCWFVGHCMVSPVYAMAKSMAMLGSVITKDMEPNHTYAGTPAVDVTDKVGPQFDLRKSGIAKQLDFEQLLQDFIIKNNFNDVDYTILYKSFDALTRQYDKCGTRLQESFLQFCFPRAKFIPYGA
mgnify:CR=1 FL=1